MRVAIVERDEKVLEELVIKDLIYSSINLNNLEDFLKRKIFFLLEISNNEFIQISHFSIREALFNKHKINKNIFFIELDYFFLKVSKIVSRDLKKRETYKKPRTEIGLGLLNY